MRKEYRLKPWTRMQRGFSPLVKRAAPGAILHPKRGSPRGTAKRVFYSLPKNHLQAVSTTDVDSFVP